MATLQTDSATRSTPAPPGGRFRAILLPAIILGAPCALLFYNASYARTQGRLVAEPGTIELGDVAGGDTIEAILELVNPTRVPVTLRDVVAGCKCTVVHWSPGVVEAGERVAIPLEVNIPTEGDTFLADVHVTYAQEPTPDAPARRFKVLLVGTVIQDYRLDARELDFTGLRAGATLSLVLRGAGMRDVRVTEVRTTNPAYSTDAKQLASDPNQWAVNVDFMGVDRASSGFAEAELIIVTSSARKPEASVRLFRKGADTVQRP